MYNIHPFMTQAERDALASHLKRLKPGLVVVMDDLHYAIRLKQELGSTAVVYRRYHPSNAGGDDNVHLKLTPEQWLAGYGDVSPSHGLYLYQNNEPSASPETFAHARECARLAVQNGHRICTLNFSVGVPELADWKGSAAQLFLRFAGDNPSHVIVGLHEYAASFSGMEWGLQNDPATWPHMVGGASWLIARYRHLLKLCDEMGIKRPRIGITEHGFDNIAAAFDYQNGLPHTNGLIGAIFANVEAWNQMKPGHLNWPQYMVEQLHWMWRAIYSRDPEIVGLANFCWGAADGSRWQLYDMKRVPGIVGLMEAKDWKPMTTTPTPPPSNLAWPVELRWGVPMKFRPTPSTGIAHTAVIPANTAVALESANVQTNGGYVWMHVRHGGRVGWVALGVVTP